MQSHNKSNVCRWLILVLGLFLTLIKSSFLFYIREPQTLKQNKQTNKENTDSPENLNGAPQIKNKEHDWLVVHFLHASKNDEEDEIPPNDLKEEKKV